MKLATGAIDDAESLKDAIPPNVDAVFHVAGDTSLWKAANLQQNRTNIDGTRNMVEAALAAGAKRFIHTSSIAAYGLIREPFDETAAQRGGQSWINYFRSKFQGEREVHKGIGNGLDAVILNPPHIVGRYDSRNWARMIVMVDQQKLPGVPPGGGSFTHGEAVAKAHLAAFERGRTGENYLLAGVDSNYVEFVKIIGRAPRPQGAQAGCARVVVEIPRPHQWRRRRLYGQGTRYYARGRDAGLRTPLYRLDQSQR